MADSGFYSVLSIISVVGVVVCLYFNYQNSKKIAIFFLPVISFVLHYSLRPW